MRKIAKVVIALVLMLSITPLLSNQSASAATGSDIVSFAKKFQGTPYVFGGTTPSGFDCSGYTQYVFKQNGVNIPRDTGSQWNTGTSVAKSDLQPGDLVFFANTYKRGISHVGIYVGNNSFINAENAGVKITSLSNPYWGPKYYGAKRVIKSAPQQVVYDEFQDIKNHPAKTAIETLNDQGVIAGYNSAEFRPDGTITRGQAAAIVNRILKKSPSNLNVFPDVGANNAFQKDIAAMQEAGIITGYTNGSFGPYGNITREQMAIILDRAFALSALEGVVSTASGYTDVSPSSAVYKPIQSIYMIDKTTVFQTSTFRGKDAATRADFSAAVYSALEAK
ncbi:NlpC/P60 family protein [Jeotgalibacillus sp. JSM ZJ347]|uniref:C40 family peptidase n=1 Tax=Jeotgalibacillus sp. JSM ZJ347 TaxID=3342117 RepID=UPI0035A90845